MNIKKTFSTTPPTPTTVLVGLSLPHISKKQAQEDLNELASLAITNGITPLASFIQQLDQPNTKTWIGSGKVEEIAVFVKTHKVDSVLFDNELSPGKIKNLTKMLNCQVWDRTLLILDIFAMRAKTIQAKTQVKLAKYEYLLPRLTRMWTHLSRQKGKAGMQGTGEKELETDRRIVKDKIHLLKKKLKTIEKQNTTQSKRRKSCVNVALVGYTNAGKSTLMNILSKAETVVENKLFATLSTTVRKVVLKDTPFLLSDTVGFIHKLPHMLVECFKSTLAQVSNADLLIHVVDFSSNHFEHHIQVVHHTLKALKAENIPMILVFNKLDNINEDRVDSLYTKKDYTSLQEKYTLQYQRPVVIISAQKKINLSQLKELLHCEIHKKHIKLYPHSKNLSS